jgi:arylsulfatase
MWEDGWKAVAVHSPISGKGHFDKDEWQLYNTNEDRAEANDIAKQNPEKLEHLKKLWFEEADKNNVLPLDDRSALEILAIKRPTSEPPRERYIYYPGTAPVPEGVSANIRGRSYKILANVEITDPNASGIIFTQGSRFGGHTLFIKDKKVYYIYNFLGMKPEQKLVSTPLKPGKYTVGVEFIKEKSGQYYESIGTAKLYINEKTVAEGPFRTQPGKFGLAGGGLCVGYNSRDPVSREYTLPGVFKGGTILFIGITVEKTGYEDLQQEAARAFLRD